MNRKIFIILIILVVLTTCGLYKVYINKDNESITYYLLQVGAYKNYENISKITKEYENYLIHKENDIYKMYIGITLDENIYDKLERIYNNKTIYKKKINLSNKKFETMIKKYDKLINNIDDKTELNLIIKEELKKLESVLEK